MQAGSKHTGIYSIHFKVLSVRSLVMDYVAATQLYSVIKCPNSKRAITAFLLPGFDKVAELPGPILCK